MIEGRIKSNIKEPQLECDDCGYYDYQNKFKFGILWWKNEHCPKCWSSDLVNVKLKANPPKPIKPKKL